MTVWPWDAKLYTQSASTSILKGQGLPQEHIEPRGKDPGGIVKRIAMQAAGARRYIRGIGPQVGLQKMYLN